MAINVAQAQELLSAFDFQKLFVETLGWNRPPRGLMPTTWSQHGLVVIRTPIAELAGVLVFEITTGDGVIPDEAIRRAIDADVAQHYHEHLLIFINADRTSSLWYWVKRENGKRYPRRHAFVQGQTGDAMIPKLSAMLVDISELDPQSGNLPLVEAIQRIRQALDVEPVTRSFFADFQKLHDTLAASISGVPDENDRRWYASALLNRLMFVYFLQRRGFLNHGDYDYLRQQLTASQQRGQDRFYHEFLQTLFFEGFAKPASDRKPKVEDLIGRIRYLNGGLFLPHQVEQRYPDMRVPDHVFDEILTLFASYDWALDDSPTGNEREINPAVLGYILEKYINQKAFGAYYTRTEITEYLCEQTIHRLVLDRVNETLPLGAKPFETIGDLLLKPSPQVCRHALLRILPDLRLIDPACGSGAFLAAAMRTLIEIYSGLVGKAKFAGDPTLDTWLKQIERDHPNIDYFIKKRIIVDNLYGVDIMPEAVEIARLRLFLALVASAREADDLEPLPNIDFNILSGNSLVGLLRVDEQRVESKLAEPTNPQQLALFDPLRYQSYHEIVAEKNRLVASYRNAAETLHAEDLGALRDEIQRHRADAGRLLDELLLDDFQALGIRYEGATWDLTQGKEGKPIRRPLMLHDIRALQPFHWGYEFDEVMNERGGFDAIITNPPWEIFKPDAKEFFTDYSNLVSKKKMTVKDFEREQARLLQDSELLSAWLDYLSRFPHQSEYFREAAQYQFQTAVVSGKRTSSDVNLYKLFVEQCFNLLRDGGQCGIVVPSGIYTDLGATGLRRLLFEQGQVRSIISLSNERFLFAGVHHSFRYAFLTFEKGGQTNEFDVAFRINPREAIGPEYIDTFLNSPGLHLTMTLDFIRQLSPQTLSVVEFRSLADMSIATKLVRFPLLGQDDNQPWKFSLGNEFHMKNDSRLFKTQPAPGCLPLFEGKMIYQFTHLLAKPRYWIDEMAGRKALLGRTPDVGQRLSYQGYRLGHRSVASSTNQRTMIATILPPRTFYGHSINATPAMDGKTLLFLASVLNSFVFDYSLRLRVSTNLTMSFIYQLPVPRLTEINPRFAPMIERAARLICTTAEYDALAAEVGLGDHSAGVTDEAERNRLRAELDGLVAHLYELSEGELTHILGAFPLVEHTQKDAVLSAYRAFAPNPNDAQLAALIADGESDRVEFKVAAAWNAAQSKKDMTMRDNVVQGVAAFLNSKEGGSLIIGVDKYGKIVGIADDMAYADPGKPNRDGYELYLRNSLASAMGASHTQSYSISFHEIGGKEVCRIAVQPSPRPVYVNGDLYVRDGNSKKKLSAQQAIEYIKHNWPS